LSGGCVAELAGLRVERRGRPVVDGVSACIPRGSVVAVIGPNGAGKSSLLAAVAGLLRPSSGRVLVEGRDVHRLGARERALLVSYAPAEPLPRGLGQTVEEFVAASRYPLGGGLLGPAPGDLAEARRLLASLGAEGLAGRSLAETSSGEAQRALVAYALARGAPLAVLDEPTGFQDVRGRVLVYTALRRYASRGRGVLVATHDFLLAQHYADLVLVLRRGRVAAAGPPGEALTPRLVEEVYGVRVEVRPVPVPTGLASSSRQPQERPRVA